jgi:hypothetical protein
MEAASTSETLVNFYQATWRNDPEDSHLQNLIRRKTFGTGYEIHSHKLLTVF